MDKVKILSNVNAFPDVQKTFQDIEKILNGLIDATVTEAETEVTDSEGESGNIQITRNEDKTYSFEVRTEDGWKTPVIGNSAIKFKDKPAEASKSQKKSIDEIEVDDTTTSAKEAEKTIFDEKANKFVMARPDFDSGWHEWTMNERNGNDDTPLTIAHGLGVLPSTVMSFYAPDQSPGSITWFTPFTFGRGAGYDNGVGCYVDTTNIYMWAGEGNSLVGIPWPIDHYGQAVFADGSVRTLLWK